MSGVHLPAAEFAEPQLDTTNFMLISSETHVAMAKLLRGMAKSIAEPERGQAIKTSNSHLACAILAARRRGGISPSGFDLESVSPDWSIIDSQIARLKPRDVRDEGLAQDPFVVATSLEHEEGQYAQVRQLIKQAIESPTPEGLAHFLDFTTRFRRLAVWNARMAHIQRPGARIIASEFEWQSIGRHVLPDAVPIIILWPFSPIRFVYELADTGPPLDREELKDPFATKGEFRPGVLSALASSLKKQKHFKVKLESQRHGFTRRS